MKAKINAYREIRSAEILIDLVALIQGPNKSGKSSIAGAIRAAVTGDPAPDARMHSWMKWTKGELKSLVNTAQGSVASCVVGDEGNAARMVWPDGDFRTKGREPRCSLTAAGVWSASLASLSETKRSAALVDVLSSLVQEEDWRLYLKDSVVPATPERDIQGQAWAKIQEAGWEVALKHAQDAARKLKGEWKQITGAEWGVAKAQNWRPETWTPEMEELTPEAAQAAVEAAAAQLQQLGVDSAMTQARIASLKAMADGIPGLQEQLASLETMRDKAESQLAEVEAAYAALPAAGDGSQHTCPNCSATLHIQVDFQTHKVASVGVEKSKLTPDEIKEVRLKRAGFDGEKIRLRNNIEAIKNKLVLATRDLEEAHKAVAKLEEVKSVDPAKIAEAQKLLERAQANQAARLQVDAATRKQGSIAISLALVDAMDPKGVRRTVMLKRMEEFNGKLAEISTQMGIGWVQIDGSTFDIKIGDKHYKDEADSEQFRARVVMQVATAEIDGSDLVIIDNDVDMDTRYYQRLLGMLLKRGMRGVVSMRCDKIDRAINTAKAPQPQVRDQIKSYWLENGTATLLQGPQAAD